MDASHTASSPGDIASFTSSGERTGFFRSGDVTASLLRPWTPPRSRALYVGLSGGMGSGKSAVARVWEGLGASVVSADDLAREVVAPGSPGLAEIVEVFGPTVLTDDGALNRGRLADIVFADDEARVVLEKITHPRIAAQAGAFVSATDPNGVAVYDVPLLVEKDMASDFDCVVMVDAPLHVRLTRLEKRGVPTDIALARIASQADAPARLPHANIWIDNRGDYAQLSEVASKVLMNWLNGGDPKDNRRVPLEDRSHQNHLAKDG